MSAIYRLIDTETGEAEPTTYLKANAVLAGYMREGHFPHVRTNPAQGTPEAAGSAPVTVMFVSAKDDTPAGNDTGRLLCAVEITDAAYPDHNTES